MPMKGETTNRYEPIRRNGPIKFELPECIGRDEPEVVQPARFNVDKRIRKKLRNFKKKRK